jgi:MoxR-like ATPase
MVLATQNPVELEGTFPLPEAQIDRFLLRVVIGYPTQSEENTILERFRDQDPLSELQSVIETGEIIALQKERRQVKIEASVRDYIVRIARSTRDNPDIQLGASPRATLSLYQVSQAWAGIQGRSFVIPDDVKKTAPSVLGHRLIISPQAQLRGRLAGELISDIVASVPVPIDT